MQTEMHGSSTEHRGSRLAPLSIRLTATADGRLLSRSFSPFALNLCVLGFCVCVCHSHSTLAVLTQPLFSFLPPHPLPNLSTGFWTQKESELAAVGSRMLFPNCGVMPGSEEMPSSRGPPGVTDLGLGLQSLRLSGWDRPWSSQDTDSHTHPSQVQSSSPSSKYRSISTMCRVGVRGGWGWGHLATLWLNSHGGCGVAC